MSDNDQRLRDEARRECGELTAQLEQFVAERDEQKRISDALCSEGAGKIDELRAERDHLLTLRAQLEQERARNAALEKERDEETRRWQDAIRDKILAELPDAHIDGAGCDSGDPLDLTLAEVGQGLAHVIDKLDDAKKNEKFAWDNTREIDKVRIKAETDRDSLRATLAALQQRCARLETAARQALLAFNVAATPLPEDRQEILAAAAALRAALAPDAGSGAAEGGAKP